MSFCVLLVYYYDYYCYYYYEYTSKCNKHALHSQYLELLSNPDIFGFSDVTADLQSMTF